MGELNREDILALRFEIAELRREMAQLRRELTEHSLPATTLAVPPVDQGVQEGASTDQIVTEWLEGEEAWKAKENAR
jgi:hypothetical protein